MSLSNGSCTVVSALVQESECLPFDSCQEKPDMSLLPEDALQCCITVTSPVKRTVMLEQFRLIFQLQLFLFNVEKDLERLPLASLTVSSCIPFVSFELQLVRRQKIYLGPREGRRDGEEQRRPLSSLSAHPVLVFPFSSAEVTKELSCKKRVKRLNLNFFRYSLKIKPLPASSRIYFAPCGKFDIDGNFDNHGK